MKLNIESKLIKTGTALALGLGLSELAPRLGNEINNAVRLTNAPYNPDALTAIGQALDWTVRNGAEAAIYTGLFAVAYEIYDKVRDRVNEKYHLGRHGL